jgi:NAD(P)-dependent dehydrogenase (short-subunit alcohol dehydrogenase family)
MTLAAAGADVVVADVDDEGGRETARLIHASGGSGIFVRADMANASDVDDLVLAAVSHYGRLDCAVNNAAVFGQRQYVADDSEQNWDRVLSINLKGVWLCMKHELAQMLKQGGGSIVNMSSGAGLVGQRGSGAYSASKHGIIGLTRTAALEYATSGIRINAVCPGIIQTPMLDRETRGDASLVEALTSLHPIGRLGRVEEVAEVVLWLCSEAASFVTGHALVVDGGATIQ